MQNLEFQKCVIMPGFRKSGQILYENYNAKQKHLGWKKGEANQKQQLSDYKSIHSYTCD